LSNFLNTNDMETVKEKIDVIYPQGNDLLEVMETELIDKGIENRREKVKRDIAINMILDGQTNEKIIKYTKLNFKEVENLRIELLILMEK